MVAELCRMIENAEQAPTLAQLAAYAGLSVFHLHRVFKAITGLDAEALCDSASQPTSRGPNSAEPTR